MRGKAEKINTFSIAEKENHIITPRQQASGQSFKKNTN